MMFGLQAKEAKKNDLHLIHDKGAQTVSLYRKGNDTPLIVQNAKKDFRPYIHPIVGPDGKGELTQYSPRHHKHQTGVYWAFTGVNGRDYFHHPEGSYWKKKSMEIINGQGAEVKWKTVYHLLAKNGGPVMEETQTWSVLDTGKEFVMDLEWSGKAVVDLSVKKYPYGGLFLRMAYERGAKAEARNTKGQKNGETEGMRAPWVNVGMKIPGRDNWGNITVFDHPDNPEYPNFWRVDRQFGFGPASARGAGWSLKQGESRTYKHRLVVYTGQFNKELIDQTWAEWAGKVLNPKN